jgi:hypothetical protein
MENNGLGRVQLRVHIAPVGFEVRRVVEPLIQLRADRAHLITGRPDDHAADYWRKIHRSLQEDYKTLDVKDWFENPWDFHALLRLYGRICQEERAAGNMMFVNVSTGTKISAMVGLLAAMFWEATPYYANTSYISKSEVVQDISYPPILRFEVLPEDLRSVLLLLNGSERALSKEDLIELLRARDVIPAKGEISDASAYRRIDGLLAPLIRQNFVRIRGNRKAGRIELTDPGRAAVLLLGAPYTETPNAAQKPSHRN